MISNQVRQLVQDIFLQSRNEDVHQEVREDPEAYLISLLTVIKKDLPDISSTLRWTVQSASFDKNLEEVRKKLQEVS